MNVNPRYRSFYEAYVAPKRGGRRPRKYGPGEPFASVDEFMALVVSAMAEKRNVCVWRNVFVWRDFGNGKGRPEHIFWTANTSAFQLVHRLIPSGFVRKAVVTQEYRDWLAKEAQATVDGA